MTDCPVLKAFADAIGADLPPNTDDESKRRARAYALVEAALHVYGPAACRKAGRADMAAKLMAAEIDAGDGPAGHSFRQGAGHIAWEALGEAEYRVTLGKTGHPWLQSGEPTTSTGRTFGETDTERWVLWAKRSATWAMRADMADEATALLGELAS